MNDNELLHYVVLFLDHELTRNELEDRVIELYANCEVFSSLAFDVIKYVTMNLSTGELRVRLARVVDRSTVGLHLVA